MQADTVERAFSELHRRFSRARIATAALDARLIVQRSLAISHGDFIARPGLPVTSASRREMSDLAARREAGEPVSRLFGEREFRGLAFSITRHTFDPRPDTETLVEAALDAARARLGEVERPRVLELGAGTGAVIISLLAGLPHAEGTAVDICSHALAVAQRNAHRHGVADRLTFHNGSWFEGLRGNFDLVVTNPPYLRTEDLSGLSPEVADHDPRIALDGRRDGLDAYRQIGVGAWKCMSAGGLLLLEIGCGQREAVVGLMLERGYRAPNDLAGVRRDLAGIERVLILEVQPR
ncbi:MAG: peptide chain release factor N(5)-glutamine methyltransferase [Pseudomonadota bacterium]|nr:peptide chain release factor N(5)-glutamine methyltransferase [Pseudomonadota bacterium]